MRPPAYYDGKQYAELHEHRPCLGILVKEWGYSPADALHFAMGFHAGKIALGQVAKSRCGCGKPSGSCGCGVGQ